MRFTRIHNRLFLWLWVIAAMVFAGLTIWIWVRGQLFFDIPVLQFFSEQRSTSLDMFFAVITWLGSTQVMIVLSVLLLGVLIVRRCKHDALMFAVGFYGANLINVGLKHLVGRVRPDVFPAVISLPSSFSFPSGHTTRFTAFALCVVFLVQHFRPQWVKPAILVFVPLVVLTALSRVYLQVHYPSDVLGSILLAVAWVLVVVKVMDNKF